MKNNNGYPEGTEILPGELPKLQLKDLIKNNKVQFHYLRQGVAYYKVEYNNIFYKFPVPLDDIGTATLLSEDKAIIFMRWIRKAMESNELSTNMN